MIGGLPYPGPSVDTSAATTQANEPLASCATGYDPGQTIWYSFTPSETGSVSADIVNPNAAIAMYEGASLVSLTEVACRRSENLHPVITFRAEVGTTYYLQVTTLYSALGQSMSLSLGVAPPPAAYFEFWPSDPSTHDTIGFSENSWDPAQAGFASWEWEFGDGTTSSVHYPTHRYATDGDFTVTLTVTTVDGRTASTSHLLQVRTSPSNDTTPPVISMNTPSEEAVYALDEVVLADFACEDESGGSGVASCVGDVAVGDPIDTASVGPKSFTVVATDIAGNSASLTYNYRVVHPTLTITSNTKLTQDHWGAIVIAANRVTLDCANHLVTGSGTGNVILIDGHSGVTVKNCRITGGRLRAGRGELDRSEHAPEQLQLLQPIGRDQPPRCRYDDAHRERG